MPVVHAMTGMRGAGKTHLAAAYARAGSAAGRRLVAWVNAGDRVSLLAGLATVADATGLSGGARMAAVDAGLAVRHRLETDGDGCLIIFDNVSDPDVLRPFVPATGAARVLITSDRQSAASLGTTVPVDVFSPDQALTFLVNRTGLTDAAGAAAVAAELGYLPLALAQAAAVITAPDLCYRTYLERLRALPAQEYPTPGQGQLYPPGVPEAVLLNLDGVRAGDQGGECVRVMETMAVLSEAGIHRDLLYAAGQSGALVGGSGGVLAANVVDRALAQLARRSLLSFSIGGQTVIAHQLVLRVVRDSLTRTGRLATLCQGVASALEAYAETLKGSKDRRAIRDVPMQVAALLDNTAASADEADKELARLLLSLRFWALYHLNGLGDSAAQAVAVGEPLTTDLDRMLGPDHRDTLLSRDGLALAYASAGRVAEAIPLHEQVLATREHVLGPDHPDTLQSRDNLAEAYLEAGRAAEAIPLHEQVLAARERLLGPDHPHTLESRDNLALAYWAAGRVAEAIPLFEQTLSARQRVLGADHPDTLTSGNNLAAAYWAGRRAAEAIPLHEQTLAARERVLGSDHPATLTSWNNLAAAYRDVGRIAEAISLFEQVLAARERVLGPDHPATLTSRENVAMARSKRPKRSKRSKRSKPESTA
jgi:tetratricopeptide (TPR) repeat protein